MKPELYAFVVCSIALLVGVPAMTIVIILVILNFGK